MSLSFQQQFWRAKWLKKSEVAPPMNMLLQLAQVSHKRAKSFNERLRSDNVKYCEKVWQKTDNLLTRRHADIHEMGKSYIHTSSALRLYALPQSALPHIVFALINLCNLVIYAHVLCAPAFCTPAFCAPALCAPAF